MTTDTGVENCSIYHRRFAPCGIQLVEKASQSSRPQPRMGWNRFFRRHARRKKHFSRSAHTSPALNPSAAGSMRRGGATKRADAGRKRRRRARPAQQSAVCDDEVQFLCRTRPRCGLVRQSLYHRYFAPCGILASPALPAGGRARIAPKASMPAALRLVYHIQNTGKLPRLVLHRAGNREGGRFWSRQKNGPTAG